MKFTARLTYLLRKPYLGGIAFAILRLLGIHIPRSVVIGPNLQLPHGGRGIVMHPRTQIGAGVCIMHNVTLGRAAAYDFSIEHLFGGIFIDDGAVIGSGAAILGGQELLRIGKNSVIGANSVLLKSVGDDEIWAGNPARFIRKRSEPASGG